MTAELLRRAADHITKCACSVDTGQLGGIPGPDGYWTAALHPKVAAPLAAWLRATVHEAEETELYANQPTEALTAAVDLARAILGEQP